jgi:hypothetical protein
LKLAVTQNNGLAPFTGSILIKRLQLIGLITGVELLDLSLPHLNLLNLLAELLVLSLQK